ncbi:tetratricopeptide repeat protein [Streptosporangium sp. NPDC000396]|uniref:tetratricopeptide repeat protein n=1 Tax=Streptosporangium sp. NPDC000396 TaxID=3366185 RepID=UPI0036B7BB11
MGAHGRVLQAARHGVDHVARGRPLGEVVGAHEYERARRLYHEGLRAAEELGLWPEVSYKLSGLGRLALLARDYEQAADLHERARHLAVEHGFKPAEIYAEIGLGLGARRAGEPDAAEKHLRAVLEWYRRVDHEPGNALILAELGFVAEQRGDAEAALALHLDAFTVSRDVIGDRRAMALALEGLAGARSLAGRHDQAALLLGAASAARKAADAPLPPAERSDVDRITDASVRALGGARFAAEFERGSALDPDQARSLAAAPAPEPARSSKG